MRIFWADALAQLGQNMLFMLIPALIESATNDLALTGLAFAGEIAAYGLFSPFSGWIADRWNQKLVMQVSNIGRVATLLGLAWALFAQFPLWGFLALSVSLGVFGTLFTPARAAFLRRILDGEALIQASEMEGTVLFLMRLLAPAVVGLVLLASNVYWALGLNALVYLLSSALLVPGWVTGPWKGIEDTGESVVHQLMLGWRTIFSSNILVQMLMIDFLICVIGMGTWASASALLQTVAHQPAAANGWLSASMGVAGAVGSRLTRGVKATSKNLTLVLLGIASSYLLLLGANSLAAICVCWFIRGLAVGVFVVLISQQLARQVPSDSIGRVQSSWEQAANLACFFGSASSPWLLHHLGVIHTFQAYSAVMLVISSIWSILWWRGTNARS